MLELTYLTFDDLKSYTPISNNVDVSLLENFISVAEQMHIIPILGTALDTALKQELELNGTLSGNNLTLLSHIKNASSWFCFYESATFLRTKAMNKGLVQQFSDNSQTVQLDDFRDYKQSILDKAHFYRNALIDFLNTNRTTYPLYRSDDTCNVASKDNSSGIYL